MAVNLKRHQVGNRPEVFDIYAADPRQHRFRHPACHDLHIAADESLEVGRPCIEHDRENIQSLIFEKPFVLGDVDR
jgi:hypothetical protein